METKIDSFEKIVKSKNPEEINDFLIKLSENPSIDYLSFINYFIDNLESHILEKIKLNLIFIIGEIGEIAPLGDKYLEFLSETYYTSDRWVRNEIIQVFEKISKKSRIPDNVIQLIGHAINDDYELIKKSALRFLLDMDELPGFIFRNILYVLNSRETEAIEYCIKILERIIPDSNQLFTSMNESENYKVLKPHGIRALLLIYFKSLINLESFRERILNSSWESESKNLYIKEIETFEKILMKKL